MKLAAIQTDGRMQLGIIFDGQVLALNEAWAREQQVPFTMEELIESGLEGLARFQSLKEHLFQRESEAGTWQSEDETSFAPVVCPGRKIVCVGLNYKKHVDESGLSLPTSPVLFSKFDNTLAAHRDTVARPEPTTWLDYEAEIAVVIGKQAKDVPECEAFDYVLGYTLANDVSARDLQFASSQWLLGKTCDGFCPVGPYLVTRDEVGDINNIGIRCIVNGEVRQDANTNQMIFSFANLIHYISAHMTLQPGDVILTGTPDGVILGMPEDQREWLKPGDVVQVQADCLGTLTTTIG